MVRVDSEHQDEQSSGLWGAQTQSALETERFCRAIEFTRPTRRAGYLAAAGSQARGEGRLLELSGARAQQGQLDQPAQSEIDRRSEQAGPPESR